MARLAVNVGAVLLPLAAVAAGLLRGGLAAATAAGAVLLVVAWFAASAGPLAWAVQRGAHATVLVAVGGYVVRVVTLGILSAVLAPVLPVDGPVLAVTVAVAMVALLVTEVRYALTHAELWWLTIDGRDHA